MSVRMVGCSTKLLLTLIGWLLLAGFQFSHAAQNVTAIQDPTVSHEAKTESNFENDNNEEDAEDETEIPESEAMAEPEEKIYNKTVVKEIEFGMCTVTCGVGIREVILTNGCPGGESKCIVRVEECRGPIDCGWGSPISESLERVRIACIHLSPENRFKYMWKLIKPDQQPIVLSNDTAILEIQRENHPLIFECDSLDNGELVASIKFMIYTTNDLHLRSTRTNDNAVLVFVLTIGVVICIFLLFILVFIIVNWTAVKTLWNDKNHSNETQSETSSMKKESGSYDQLPTDMPMQDEDDEEALSDQWT